jgi:uncharacterized protein (DUF952 family)
MGFQLTDVIPWGRSFDEYVAMFALTAGDLRKPILGCGDGPASFNAVLTARGGTVESIDPLYAFGADDIRRRIDEVRPVVLEQTRQSADAFVWRQIGSVDELERTRLASMDAFLADYRRAESRPRYRSGELPALPYGDGEFALTLCSHFLFLYSEQLSLQFHIDSVTELCRVASEARIFPLLELGGAESRHLRPLVDDLRSRGFSVTIAPVPYEFQRGGNQMLVARKPSPVILHLTTEAAWAAAVRAGAYTADSLASEGFIHCSDPRQVIWVANTRFRHRRDLVLLQIAVAKLEAPIRYENLEGGSDLFPHVYGPLNMSAIVRVTPFLPDNDGAFDHSLSVIHEQSHTDTES